MLDFKGKCLKHEIAPVLWLTRASVCYSVYIHCTFREYLSYFLFYFENACQAAIILNLLYSTQHPEHNSFVPEIAEGTLITKHWFQ
jgi:hypothetical protein